MLYDKQQIASKLLHWEEFLHEFRLPVWDELPQIELYMDQVIVLLNEYLSYFVYEGNDEKLITAAMVNNYVKMKLVPAPVRKKYGRVHLAYLIMICTLKQSLRLSMLPALLPGNLPEEDVRRIYTAFVRRQRLCARESWSLQSSSTAASTSSVRPAICFLSAAEGAASTQSARS